MSRHEKIAREIKHLQEREHELVEKLADVVLRRRRKNASLNRSLSALARGARPPSPRERGERAQDEGDARARREERAARPPPGAPGGVAKARAKLAARGEGIRAPRRRNAT